MCEIPDTIANASTTLLCHSPMPGESGYAGSETCLGLLSSAGLDATVVLVTFTCPPAACLEAYPRAVGTDDAPSLTVVAVGDASTAADPSIADVDVDTVSTPSDLTCLGITLSQELSAADDVVLCFDSLTALLQNVPVETVYEFLHAVVGQLDAADASAHVHLDPTAHDRQTVDTLAPLFDTVVEVDDGERTVRTRQFSRETT
ncbi:hypothetical protein NDI85_14580 [Halomicroarcula sp. S1AR25-4]|uniref:DUF7504 family protein n=1 Tax=Haloarcula sp. S1AR25-4 TaxID=2950538 RepID=UPI002875B4F0|nr:hypothetical protein [Halomicroarcula sp. S1AR25-4]MDS0279023.1 hypothetical protein [Halomicroarcula sp. S1AR25-4]